MIAVDTSFVIVVVLAIVMFGGMGALFFGSERRFRASGYDRRRRPPGSTPNHVFNPASSASLRGGARVGWSNASWPLVKLTVDQDWLKLAWVPPVWMPREEVTAVEVIRGMMGPGVVFRSADGRFDGVIFWTFSTAAVLATLERFGWPIGPSSPPT